MILAVAQLALLILRLDGTVEWSWWLILSPTWVTLVYFMLCGADFSVSYGEIVRDHEDGDEN